MKDHHVLRILFRGTTMDKTWPCILDKTQKSHFIDNLCKIVSVDDPWSGSQFENLYPPAIYRYTIQFKYDIVIVRNGRHL